MNIVTLIRERAVRLAACAELDVEASALPGSARGLSDQSVMDLLSEVSALINDATRVQAVLAGVTVQRSRRADGGRGLAATLGHPTPASLIQAITGGTRADATRHVRVGTSLLDGVGDQSGGSSAAADAAVDTVPWFEPLRRAYLGGKLTSAQKDAIHLGLGDPPTSAESTAETVHQAWSLAAESLIDEAMGMPAEELLRRARSMRDMLDPVGAEERYARRYEKRSFHMWVDDEGQHRARITFDDEMALWVRSVRDAALRPRRGGPRFVTEEERAAAAQLVADDRTNEQLEYDLIVDLLRAGSLATASDVFGRRQPGVRMIVIKDAVGPRDAFGRMLAHGYAEDGGDTLPGSVIDRAVCMHGSVDLSFDREGNPLDVGREQRLYSPRQRIALAARDGGCLWPECTRPASYCEAHHCDHFVEHHGRTDIDRGVLLCRFHHMTLHNHGWRVTRRGSDPFVLHPPPGGGPPIRLTSKAPWKWAWGPPPPTRHFGWRTAPATLAVLNAPAA